MLYFFFFLHVWLLLETPDVHGGKKFPVKTSTLPCSAVAGMQNQPRRSQSMLGRLHKGASADKEGASSAQGAPNTA